MYEHRQELGVLPIHAREGVVAEEVRELRERSGHPSVHQRDLGEGDHGRAGEEGERDGSAETRQPTAIGDDTQALRCDRRKRVYRQANPHDHEQPGGGTDQRAPGHRRSQALDERQGQDAHERQADRFHGVVVRVESRMRAEEHRTGREHGQLQVASCRPGQNLQRGPPEDERRQTRVRFSADRQIPTSYCSKDSWR